MAENVFAAYARYRGAVSTLIVLAKAPLTGRVKTRLCPPCSPAEAALIAEAALRDTLDVATTCGASRVVVVLDGPRPDWFPPELEVIGQRDGGLDVRLSDAFSDVLGLSTDPTLLVAMDTPHLSADWLRGGFVALDSGADAVIGMAHDGGFWLVGLHRPNRMVFEGLPMSTTKTGDAQRFRIESLGMRIAVLPETFDIDTTEDLDRLVDEHPELRTSNVWRAIRNPLRSR